VAFTTKSRVGRFDMGDFDLCNRVISPKSYGITANDFDLNSPVRYIAI